MVAWLWENWHNMAITTIVNLHKFVLHSMYWYTTMSVYGVQPLCIYIGIEVFFPMYTIKEFLNSVAAVMYKLRLFVCLYNFYTMIYICIYYSVWAQSQQHVCWELRNIKGKEHEELWRQRLSIGLLTQSKLWEDEWMLPNIESTMSTIKIVILIMFGS